MKKMNESDNITHAVAWCHHRMHWGNMTLKMVKKHECLKKQCPFLEKFEDHPYWKQRAIKKQKKKEKKNVLRYQSNSERD